MSYQLSDTEMRVLSILEEFEYENVPAMMNTIIQPTGDPGELNAMLGALSSLVRRGLVNMCIDRDSQGFINPLPVEPSLDVVNNLEPHLIFDGARSLWTDARRKGPPFGSVFPLMLATKEARILGREILQDRGYRWWEPARR